MGERARHRAEGKEMKLKRHDSDFLCSFACLAALWHSLLTTFVNPQ